MKEMNYIVAGHRFVIAAGRDMEPLTEYMDNYEPFFVDGNKAQDAAEAIFRVEIVPDSSIPQPDGIINEFVQDDEGARIRLYNTRTGESRMEFYCGDRLAGRLLASPDFSQARFSVLIRSSFVISNALMILYAIRTSRLGTALFHAAVIGNGGRGYLFLGKSGTGKSTHARLWLKHVEGSELVNDDNPVVRVFPDGSAKVYGSPWSGKTPCYRNVELPAGAFVSLSQAPFNKISRLAGVAAYAAILPSVSGKRWDRNLADGLHETENLLTQNVPVWHLDCLPDEAAAKLCSETIRNSA